MTFRTAGQLLSALWLIPDRIARADVSELRGDVGTLKQDMTEVKGMLAEILRRLPAPPSPN